MVTREVVKELLAGHSKLRTARERARVGRLAGKMSDKMTVDVALRFEHIGRIEGEVLTRREISACVDERGDTEGPYSIATYCARRECAGILMVSKCAVRDERRRLQIDAPQGGNRAETMTTRTSFEPDKVEHARLLSLPRLNEANEIPYR